MDNIENKEIISLTNEEKEVIFAIAKKAGKDINGDILKFFVSINRDLVFAFRI